MDAPFEALGLEPSAGTEEVRRAWRRHVLATHPDRGGNREDFERGHAAYRALTLQLTSLASGRAPRPHDDPYRRFLDDLARVDAAPTRTRVREVATPPHGAQTMAQSAPSAFHSVFADALTRAG